MSGSAQSPDERQRVAVNVVRFLGESMLAVRSLKPKPNQTLLEIATDFASVTGSPKLFLRARDNQCILLQIAPKPPGTLAGTPPPPHPLPPARPGGLTTLGASAGRLENFCQAKGWTGAFQGVV